MTRSVGFSKDCTWLLQPRNCCGLASWTLSDWTSTDCPNGRYGKSTREFHYEYMLLHASSIPSMGAQMVSGWTEGTANYDVAGIDAGQSLTTDELVMRSVLSLQPARSFYWIDGRLAASRPAQHSVLLMQIRERPRGVCISSGKGSRDVGMSITLSGP